MNTEQRQQPVMGNCNEDSFRQSQQLGCELADLVALCLAEPTQGQSWNSPPFSGLKGHEDGARQQRESAACLL